MFYIGNFFKQLNYIKNHLSNALIKIYVAAIGAIEIFQPFCSWCYCPWCYSEQSNNSDQEVTNTIFPHCGMPNREKRWTKYPLWKLLMETFGRFKPRWGVQRENLIFWLFCLWCYHRWCYQLYSKLNFLLDFKINFSI